MASSATVRPARRQGACTSTDFSNNRRVKRGYEGGSVPVASGEIEIRMRVLLTATLK